VTITDIETSELSDLLAIDADTQSLLFRDAHSANTFSDEPVDDDSLRAIWDLVRFGPTMMNISPLRIVAVRSKDARERLVEHMSDGNKAKTLTAPMTLVFGYDVDFHDELGTLVPHMPAARENFAGSEEVRHELAKFNALLQSGYVIVGIRAAGFAVGPMGGFDADGVTDEVFPDGRHRALIVVNVGKPGVDAYRPRAPRLGFDEVVTTI
jgi:3-hydroxypropanoate dehydrogenase